MTAIDPRWRSTATNGGVRVALAHDFLVSRGGAERVALSMARAFPDAEIHTALHDASATFQGFRDHPIVPLGIDAVPGLRRHHRASLPLLQRAFERRVIDADVVVCSSSGFAHHVKTTGRKVVYCHTPARWLHDQERYLDRFGPVARSAAKWLGRGSRRRDAQAMMAADEIIANSSVISGQILDAFGQTATVVPPCSSLTLDAWTDPIARVDPGFVFCPSRALGYKRLDVLVDAAERLQDIQVLQVGAGPDLKRLRSRAPKNLRLLGDVPDSQLRWAYRNAAIVALTSAEDFGLVPIEAQAHGLMSVVPEARGFLDHVVDGVNGWFYDFGDAEQLATVIRDGLGTRATPPAVDPLGERRFGDVLREVVENVAMR